MAIAGGGSAQTNPAGNEGSVSGSDQSQYYPAGYKKHYTIEDLVTLATAVSYNADPIYTGVLSGVEDTYGLRGKPKAYKWDPATAAAIAMAESTGDPQARNPSGATGLWQIMPVNWDSGQTASDVEVPDTNAHLALKVFESQGWGAWTTYTSGAYKKYLSAAQSSTTGADDTANQQQLDTGQASIGASNPIGQLENIVGTLVGDLTSKSFWMMVGMILLGGIFLIMGTHMLMGGK